MPTLSPDALRRLSEAEAREALALRALDEAPDPAAVEALADACAARAVALRALSADMRRPSAQQAA